MRAPAPRPPAGWLARVATLISACALAAVSAPHPAAGQTVLPGYRVRVTTTGGKQMVGAFEQATAEGIELSDPAGRIYAFPRAEIRSFELSWGKRPDPGRGALFGAILGAAGGAVFGAAIPRNRLADWCSRGCAIGLSTGAGAAGGAGIGAILGAVIGRERWRPARVPGVGVSFRF